MAKDPDKKFMEKLGKKLDKSAAKRTKKANRPLSKRNPIMAKELDSLKELHKWAEKENYGRPKTPVPKEVRDLYKKTLPAKASTKNDPMSDKKPKPKTPAKRGATKATPKRKIKPANPSARNDMRASKPKKPMATYKSPSAKSVLKGAAKGVAKNASKFGPAGKLAVGLELGGKLASEHQDRKNAKAVEKITGEKAYAKKTGQASRQNKKDGFKKGGMIKCRGAGATRRSRKTKYI